MELGLAATISDSGHAAAETRSRWALLGPVQLSQIWGWKNQYINVNVVKKIHDRRWVNGESC